MFRADTASKHNNMMGRLHATLKFYSDMQNNRWHTKYFRAKYILNISGQNLVENKTLAVTNNPQQSYVGETTTTQSSRLHATD